MARIEGVDLPRAKRVEIGLTYIFGVGRPTARRILAATDVHPDTRVKDLTEDQITTLRDHIGLDETFQGSRQQRGLEGSDGCQ